MDILLGKCRHLLDYYAIFQSWVVLHDLLEGALIDGRCCRELLLQIIVQVLEHLSSCILLECLVHIHVFEEGLHQSIDVLDGKLVMATYQPIEISHQQVNLCLKPVLRISGGTTDYGRILEEDFELKVKFVHKRCEDCVDGIFDRLYLLASERILHLSENILQSFVFIFGVLFREK
jgi:hypothetical protein